MSLRDEILAYEDRPKAAVFVREWNNKRVLLKMLTAADRDKFDRETLRRKKKKVDIRPRERLIILCAEDENEQPLFRDSDEEALAQKSNAALDRLFRIACRHNGLIEEDEEEDEAGN